MRRNIGNMICGVLIMMFLLTVISLFCGCASLSKGGRNADVNVKQEKPHFETTVMNDATTKKHYDFFTSKFVDLGNGIVYDNETKLLWSQDANYFKRHMKLKDAEKACENLSIAGLSGWRIPEKHELARMYTVYHKQELHPFYNVEDEYLSDTVETKRMYGKDVDFWQEVDMEDRFARKTEYPDAYVWPVRGGQ